MQSITEEKEKFIGAIANIIVKGILILGIIFFAIWLLGRIFDFFKIEIPFYKFDYLFHATPPGD